jgi:Creatinase/Prolidase N-terminal domain
VRPDFPPPFTGEVRPKGGEGGKVRRGLMAWDADEIPVRVLTERAARLQTAMAASGHDAMILYTNFIRSAAVSHLTAFSPYWADGLLLVPREGEPVFATTLSKRVGSWIQSVKPVGDLVNSPTPGKVLGERLVKAGVRRVAILELDAFPAGLYTELATALPGVEFVDGSDTFASARAPADAVELRLLGRADAIARNALAVPFEANNVGAAVGAVEVHARLHGAEEVYVAIAPDLDSDRRYLRLSGERPLGRRYAIRATVAYKGSWVRRAQTYSQDSNDRPAIERADAWFKASASSNPSRRLLDRSLGLTNVRVHDWLIEAPVGTRPLAVIASSSMPKFQRAPASIWSVSLTVDGMPWCGACLVGANA